MPIHPTQIFLHHPSALRVELRLDDARLLLWWSPLAGQSYTCADRNFSHRDDHLSVFESIHLPDLDLASFQHCDYDPYRAVLHFSSFNLTLELTPDHPVLLLSATRPLTVDFKTARYDAEIVRTPSQWSVAHPEPGRDFEFSVSLGPGQGALHHAPVHAPQNALYAWARLAPNQTLALGVGLASESILAATTQLATQPRLVTRAAVESRLASDLRSGTPDFSDPRFLAFYQKTRRSLHGAIDDSGALRASLKPVYYLIWLRDGAFCFNYQASTGWLHRHADWCRFVLANPTSLDEPGLPPGRLFGQLVHRTYGKLEEDGLYYAVWSVFTYSLQTGRDDLLTPDAITTLRDALSWLEAYAFDSARGLFFSRFADESPVRLSRDHGIDAAIGARSNEPGLAYQGRLVARLYDTYLNSLCFSVYGMLAALPGLPPDFAASCREKADRLWQQLAPFFPSSGLPSYGELLMEDGDRVSAPPYQPIRSVYVWAFCLPGLAPIPNLDAIRLALLRDVMAKPRLHWNNGIAALAASVDPLTCDPAELHHVLAELTAQGERAGQYLPMPGTLPEKFDAPEGSLHDDIRPQSFAQSAFLAACASLGLRRLPFGLAVRPTRFLRAWHAYTWRESELHFDFTAPHEGVQINGQPLPGTLQLPQSALPPGPVHLTVGSLPASGTLARSNLTLLTATAQSPASTVFTFTAHGASELVFTQRPSSLLLDPPTPFLWSHESLLWFARFQASGSLQVHVTF